MLSFICYLVLVAFLIYWVELPISASTNSLNIQKNPAEGLEEWLKKFNWGSRHNPETQGPLPRYKFYTEVVETLLSLARRMGGNYQDSLLYLREGLQADCQFERRMREIVLGVWFQMGLMVVLTWVFILGSLTMVDIEVPVMKLLAILFWQSVGLGSLPFIIRYYRFQFFADIGSLWRMLYILKSLARVPLSRSEIFALAQITELKNIRQKSLTHIVEKLRETCHRSLQQGGSYEEEVGYLMGELRFQEKWHFELFEKKLGMIKLILLSIFFLPSYLAFLFVLLGDLLALM